MVTYELSSQRAPCLSPSGLRVERDGEEPIQRMTDQRCRGQFGGLVLHCRLPDSPSCILSVDGLLLLLLTHLVDVALGGSSTEDGIEAHGR